MKSVKNKCSVCGETRSDDELNGIRFVRGKASYEAVYCRKYCKSKMSELVKKIIEEAKP